MLENSRLEGLARSMSEDAYVIGEAQATEVAAPSSQYDEPGLNAATWRFPWACRDRRLHVLHLLHFSGCGLTMVNSRELGEGLVKASVYCCHHSRGA